MSVLGFCDRTVSYQRQAVTKDAASATVRTWATLATFPAAAAPVSSMVASDYARREINIDFSIYIPSELGAAPVNGPKAGDRLLDSGLTYLIHGSKFWTNSNVSAERFWELYVEQRAV